MRQNMNLSDDAKKNILWFKKKSQIHMTIKPQNPCDPYRGSLSL